jgi:hypothetical protein
LKEKSFWLNEKEAEDKMTGLMDDLDIENTQKLLRNYHIEHSLNQEAVEDIKNRVHSQLGFKIRIFDNRANALDNSIKRLEQGVGKKTKSKWKAYVASIAIFLLCAFIWKNGDNLVYAINKMFGLIPGVGIIEDNQDILYQLKETNEMITDDVELHLLNAIATKDSITVTFEIERKNITEEDLMLEKQLEWDTLMKEDRLSKPNIFLLVDGEKYEMDNGSNSGGGFTERFSYSFELSEEVVGTSKTYTILHEDYNLKVEFQLEDVKTYNSLNEIGATAVHNNISLTAESYIENNQLKVNVYPINHSNYHLISFDEGYDFEYFGKRLLLKTENGQKVATLPGSYGSGMNAVYSFDISDGSEDFYLHIPYVVVRTNEEKKVTLPIPEVGKVVELNQEVSFEEGSVIIESIEKVIEDIGGEYGALKVNLKYNSLDENNQLVQVKLTRKASEGWAEDYDDQGRLKTIYYMLEKKDKNKLNLYVTQPWYVLMDEYILNLN